MNTPTFKVYFHTWLAQPLEDWFWHTDSTLWSFIDFHSWKVPKEQIYEKYNIETWKLMETYRWSFEGVLNQIESGKKIIY